MNNDESIKHKEGKFGFKLDESLNKVFRVKILNNCVEPKVALHVFNCAFKEKQICLSSFQNHNLEELGIEQEESFQKPYHLVELQDVISLKQFKTEVLQNTQ